MGQEFGIWEGDLQVADSILQAPSNGWRQERGRGWRSICPTGFTTGAPAFGPSPCMIWRTPTPLEDMTRMPASPCGGRGRSGPEYAAGSPAARSVSVCMPTFSRRRATTDRQASASDFGICQGRGFKAMASKAGDLHLITRNSEIRARSARQTPPACNNTHRATRDPSRGNRIGSTLAPVVSPWGRVECIVDRRPILRLHSCFPLAPGTDNTHIRAPAAQRSVRVAAVS